MEYTFLGKRISGMFTIPSGLITTQPAAVAKIAREIPEIGVITTKSVGLHPREGYREPVLTQYAPGCFMNAVGLTNPGAESFARQLQNIHIPDNKFLLASIFGKDAEEFVAVAHHVAPYSDGLELNLSCPHAQGYGMSVGQDPELVRTFTAAVKQAVNIPVIPKLTPNVDNIAAIARAAVDGGADAICAINTVGPGYYTFDGKPVLSHITGGMSGKGILPIGLKCVQEIAQAVSIPIIGCGGISNADDVRAYQDAGATIFGIGSALIGLSSEELQEYFHTLQKDLEQDTHFAMSPLKSTNMSFTRYQVTENRRLSEDLVLLICDEDIGIYPGQFIFAWIPGVGEKPFSVLDDKPLTLAVRKRGCFTQHLFQLKTGDNLYIRGPYGNPVQREDFSKIVLVSGGCGLAALYLMARNFHQTEVFVGAKTGQDLFYLEKVRECANVHIATEDGSIGEKALVTELLQQRLQDGLNRADLVFFNCGPEAMVDAAIATEQQYAAPERIYSAIDYITKCGVGLCGSCAAHDGRRLCVDGPFMSTTE